MAKTVKIPGVGSVPTKYAVLGGVAVVGIAGVAWFRYANRPVDEDVEDLGTTTDYTDETIYPAYSTDYAGDASYGGSYDGGAYPYPSYTTPSYGITSTVQTADPITNSEWTQRSIEHLELIGVESQTASLAVSRYLLKECVTATQADIVRQAVAAIGLPPQGTFSIIVCPGGTGTTPGTGLPSGSSLAAPSGLHALRTFRTEIQIGWTPVKDAAGYAVFHSVPSGASSTWQRQTTSVYNSFQFKGLKPGTRYSFKVQTIGHDNKPGGSATVSATTKK